MIEIKRQNPPPSILQSPQVKKTKQELRRRVSSGEKLKSDNFPAHWSDQNLRSQLWEMQHGKCCYCERSIQIKWESDVEHFRPKTEIAELPNDQLGYWWLAYEWTNLFLSCQNCNRVKKTHFPVINEVDRARQESDDLSKEDSYLINPETSEPEDHFLYDWVQKKKIGIVFLKGKTEKGEQTIKILNLNRNELLHERTEIIQDLQLLAWSMIKAKEEGNLELIQRRKDEIWKATSSKRKFAGFRRFFFQSYGLGEYVANS
jgi:uncharacterized protein (TIGR02646 family)